ncbi:hypothetical protein TRFO_29193 [Tritrichomonas foetus]|uniref:Uncharacterized protein n=1 Tax=Tritrichomonas foetus TaxID=1144522 RepID=A0A1J4JY57_9EUKA|nr:hypothetical protein TRFO_29193 [Tritrichomonas foetus]|eukprot:OHT03392.1 hypothetical protein TRFO_29193 [Tritrichomonas foetus]
MEEIYLDHSNKFFIDEAIKYNLEKRKSSFQFQPNHSDTFFFENEQEFYLAITSFNTSVATKNIDLYGNTISQLFQLFSQIEAIPKSLVVFIQDTEFLPNIIECLDTLSDDSLKSLLILIQFMTALSNDLIESFHRNNILSRIMDIFLQEDRNIPEHIFFNIFGNCCSLNKTIAECFADPLFIKIFNSMNNSDIESQQAAIFCFHSLTSFYYPPYQMIKPLLLSMKLFIAKVDIEKPDIHFTIFQMIKSIKNLSTNEEFCHFFIVTATPTLIFSLFRAIPYSYYLCCLKIIINSFKVASAEEIMTYVPFIDFDILFHCLNSKNDKLIFHVFELFLCLIESSETNMQFLISRNIFALAASILEDANYYSKKAIIDFLSFILVNDISNSYSNEMIIEPIIETFAEIAEYGDNESNEFVGAVTKLYTLTFDFPELNQMLEPYVIDEIIDDGI